MSKEKYASLKLKAQGWREKALQGQVEIAQLAVDNENLVQQLANNNFTEENEQLKKQLRELTLNNRQTEFEQERNLLRKDTEIDRLSASLEDYKERYKEERADNKDLRKMIRNNS